MRASLISAVTLRTITAVGLLLVEASNAQLPLALDDVYGFNFSTTFYPNYCLDGKSNLTVLTHPNPGRADLCRFEGCPNAAIFDCNGWVNEEGVTDSGRYDYLCADGCNASENFRNTYFRCSYHHTLEIRYDSEAAPQCQFTTGCRNSEWFDCGAELDDADFEAICDLCDGPSSTQVDLGFQRGISLLYEDRCGAGKDLFQYDSGSQRFCWFEGCSYTSTFLCYVELAQQEYGPDYDLVCQYCDEQEHPDVYETKTVECDADQSKVLAYWNATNSSLCYLDGCKYYGWRDADCQEAVNNDDDAAFCGLCGTEEFDKVLSKFEDCTAVPSRMTRMHRICDNFCGDGSRRLHFMWPFCYVEGRDGTTYGSFECLDFILQDDDDSICQYDTGTGAPIDVASCSLYPACDGLDGNCCSTDAGIDLFCCEGSDGSCQAHSACAAEGLLGECCPTIDIDNVFLDCCENSFSKCEARGNCSHLAGDCCPTESGVFLDCCHNDQSLAEFTFPEISGLQSCSAHAECSNLAGDCCPTESGVFLYCCEKIAPQCQLHPKCAAEELADSCCPTAEGMSVVSTMGVDELGCGADF